MTAMPPIGKRVYTPEDLLTMPDDGKSYELVNGELKEQTMSFESCYVGGTIHHLLRNYEEDHPIIVMPDNTTFRCFTIEKNRVRKPDVGVILIERATSNQYYSEGHISIVPDLVVEVISPNDIAYEVRARIREWLNEGVKSLWEVYPTLHEITIHRPSGITLIDKDGTVTEPDLLPGFSATVADMLKPPKFKK